MNSPFPIKKEEKMGNIKASENTSKNSKKEKLFSEEEVKKMIAKAISQINECAEPKSKNTDENVTVMFLGGIARGTSVNLGSFGKINRDGGILEIPKKAFLSGISETFDNLLQERKLIIIDGLNQDERERYGVLYKEKELLDLNSFQHLLDFDIPQICEIFSNLCEEHKKLVCKLFTTARAENNDNRVTLEKMKALNKISKGTDKNGLFSHIIEDMGMELAKMSDSDR